MRYALIGLLGLFAVGCLDLEEPTSSYYRPPPPPGTMPPVNPASTEAAIRVDTLGRRILAANPGIGGKPMFSTIGAPQPEVFHRGTTEIFVTEGLVRQCDDDQLAAVLCLELGKMIREREATVPPQMRTRDILPPIDTRLGGDDLHGGTADRTDQYDLVKYDAERKKRRTALKLPDARALASHYLANTGFRPESLFAADGILKSVSSQPGLERQMSETQSPQ